MGFTQTFSTFPSLLTTTLGDAFRALHSDSIINGYLSERMVLDCLNAVAASLCEGIDFLDTAECSIEDILEEFLIDAAENGNLPPDEEGVYLALRKKLGTFCMDLRQAMLRIDLPVIEYIGLPYEAGGFNARGVVVWRLKNLQSVIELMFNN